MKAAPHPHAQPAPPAAAPGAAAPAGAGCPTAERPVPAREGLLARLLVPGGIVAAASFARLAEGIRALGLDDLAITNRANLQARGLSRDQAGGFVRLAREAGMLPPAHAPRRRAIVLSPLAGLDPAEAADPRPLAAALDAFLLASPHAEALAPKGGLAVDGGGAWPVRQGSLDLVLEAAGDAGWRLVLAGRDTGVAVPGLQATRALDALLDLFDETGTGRAKDLLARAGLERVRRRLLTVQGAAEVPVALPRPFDRPPLGVIATSLPGRVALGAVAPFGVLGWQAALAAARAAEQGDGLVRLTPWQGVVVAGIEAGATAGVAHMLEKAGLATDPATPHAVLHACPGSVGCLRGTGDVRAVAAAIAALAGGLAARVRHIHVSGCGRGCAWPRRADLLLLADGRGGYALHRDADARQPGDRALLAADLAPGRAADAVRAALERLPGPDGA